MHLNDVCAEAYQTAKEHGFHNESRTLGDLLMLIVSELAEALEEYRNGHRPNDIYFADHKPEGVPIEIADAVIRIGDLCSRYAIDLDSAVRMKMDYNKGRPFKHEGKLL